MSEAHKVTLKDIVNPVSEKVFPSKTDVDLRCINLEDIPEGSGHITSWTSASENLSAKTVFKKGDVLFGKLRPYLRKFAQAPFEGVCTTEIMVFRPKEGIAPGYAYQVVASEDFVEHNVAASYGTKMPRTDWATASAFRFSLPSLEEQRGIAEVLSTLDEQIEATEASISKRKIILTGLLHDLIPDPTDLMHSPGHSLLGKKAGIRRGASPRPIDSPRWFSGAGRGWVRISDVTRTNRFLAVTEQKLSPAGEACSVAVDPGQVIMSICATVGEPRMVTEPVCIHDGFVVFDRHPELDARYLRHLLVRSRPWFLARGQTGTQSNLNTGLVGSLPIAPPSIDEQELIADAIDNAYDAVDAEVAEAAKLRLQKQGLMRDLLTGKVRVH